MTLLAFPLSSQTGILPRLYRLDEMKKFLTVALVLLVCGCGDKYTGLGSVDLQIKSIVFNDSDPATITGTLLSGKPANFITAVDAPQIRSLSVQISHQADTTGMVEANNTVNFPIQVELNRALGSEGTAEFAIQHDGLSWIPDYAFRADSGTRRIYATAFLNNSTAQTWHADTIRLAAHGNGLVTTATGRLAVKPGRNTVPWWNAPAGPPEALITYGWPVRGRWNPMIAVYCPTAGRVESWTGSIYQRNDTLWFPADSLVELNLSWQQLAREYRCSIEAISLTDSTVNWRILWPERLPRGADIDPGIDSFQLSSRESVTIEYREIY